ELKRYIDNPFNPPTIQRFNASCQPFSNRHKKLSLLPRIDRVLLRDVFSSARGGFWLFWHYEPWPAAPGIWPGKDSGENGEESWLRSCTNTAWKLLSAG